MKSNEESTQKDNLTFSSIQGNMTEPDSDDENQILLNSMQQSFLYPSHRIARLFPKYLESELILAIQDSLAKEII